MPAFVTRDGGHSVGDHAARTIRYAIEQDDVGYPFRLEPPVITKTTATETMASAGSLARRVRIAATIYAALTVVDERAVRGRRVVVYDDVFTTGSTLDVVARRLREAGADEVYGLTLSRTRWR
ncbi:ComF family protein [Actinoalloteichus hoggarensis]|uniref:DNA utilization protein GntX n=2 Tax=Actinoalloteichus hoggarensis TaxID=1470176 RepID=A0A221VZ66_9PSEU|nr:phosphoribosyltransferase family protein [Actinoalloteichus hoggarensis]ASO18770.1 DNA utilization protein GntX [Actinoalloteichus hoggarensis]